MKTKTQNQTLVQGHGVNDLNEPVRINRRNLKFCAVWYSMLERCYSEKSLSKYPTYRNCSVCPEWLVLSNFKVWFDANYREGMSLDKDILIPGNKVYCPQSCVFVPGFINNLLTDAGAARGDLPLGVSAQKSKLKNGQITTTYMGRCANGHGKSLTKNFKTIAEAAAWYVTTKKRVVREIVLESFWRNDIMSDVATALLEREW